MPLSRYAGNSLSSAPSQSDKPILISIEGLPILADALDGQLLIGDSGAGMVLAFLTEGAGVIITNGPGSIEIAATGGLPTGVTDGQLLIGDTGTGEFVVAELTAGQGIFISNDPGGITISATGQTPLNVNAQIGTDYTLVAGDMGKVITLDNADPIALTVPADLGVGFSCMLMQLGAGTVTVGAGAGATVNSRGGLLDLNGQYAIASLIPTAVADVYTLGGDLV